MNDIYEQAARAVGCGASAESMRRSAGAVWSAQYGCPQCGGNKIQPDERDGVTFFDGCPSEHVLMENPHTKVQVYCDPAKAEWRCEFDNRFVTHGPYLKCTEYGVTGHEACRWVPVPEGSRTAVERPPWCCSAHCSLGAAMRFDWLRRFGEWCRHWSSHDDELDVFANNCEWCFQIRRRKIRRQ